MQELKIRLMYDNIVTTMNTKKVTNSGVIITSKKEGDILTRQTVLAAGPNAGVEVGEEIEINVDRFPKKNVGPKQVGAVSDIGSDRFVIVPPIEVLSVTDEKGVTKEEPFLFISSREIKYIYTK
jgi:hypothetical protein